MSLRILWTCPYLPWPTIGGNRVRVYQLLRALAARGHRITLLVQSPEPADDATRAALEPLLERLIVVPRRSHRHHPLSLAAATFAPYPTLVNSYGFSRPMRDSVNRLLDEPWDAVQVEHSYSLLPQLGPLSSHRQPFVLTEHNVESSLVGLNDYSSWFPAPLVRQIRRYDQRRFRNWERRIMQKAARVIAVTDQDARVMQAISGRTIDVIANGADIEGFSAVETDATSRRIMFIANFSYPPNAAAAAWAAGEIMPKVWQRLPDARFIICGNGMKPEWAGRWPDPRLEWRGYVSDLHSVQRECPVFLSPLRMGGGSKLKVLEAMSAGLAVVSTSEGVSGLLAQAGQDYLPGETTDELADAVVRLLRQPSLLRTIGESGRQYVVRHHAWPQLALQMEAIYMTLAAHP